MVKLLMDRILSEGRALSDSVLKVDGFLNHQVDADLMQEVGRDFYEYFKDYGITRVLTIESSGIAPAVMLGYVMQLPVVFVKKKVPKTLDNFYIRDVHSFTKDRTYTVSISADYLTPEDHIVFIDDFLAYGNAARGVIDLCAQSGSTIEAMGFVIEKALQGGGDTLRSEGYDIISLATVERLEDGKIFLKD